MLFVLLRIKLKYLNFINIKIWKVVGVVERGRFEICWTSNCSGGSNPSLSAIFYKLRRICEWFSADRICIDISYCESLVVGTPSTKVATRRIWLRHIDKTSLLPKANCKKYASLYFFICAIAFVLWLNVIN